MTAPLSGSRKSAEWPDVDSLVRIWEHVYTDESYGAQGKNLGLLAREIVRLRSLLSETGPSDECRQCGCWSRATGCCKSNVASTESIGAAWLKDDLTYMKEPLVNARTGEEVKGEVRWTVWWNGPDAATFREALALSASSSWERK